MPHYIHQLIITQFLNNQLRSKAEKKGKNPLHKQNLDVVLKHAGIEGNFLTRFKGRHP
jgi:hypothetical protein